MLNQLTEFALAQRWLVLGVTLLLAALGVRAFQQIPIDAFPDVSTTQVKLILKAPGMTPEEVEARITQSVETELLGIPQQTILRSVSKYALADITVDFAEGTDIYWARSQVAERNDGVQYLRAEIDRQAAGRFGLSVDDIATLLRTQLEGEVIGALQQQGRRIPLQLRGMADLRTAPDALQRLRLTLADGRTISLAQVAKLVRTDGPVGIKRENAARFVAIQSNVSGRDLVGFVEEAQRALAAEVQLPAGYSVTWGGQFENQQRAAQRLMLVVPLALLLIGLLLFLTFRDLRQTVLIMANVPLALIGGVVSLWVSGQYLSVPASVGFIALLGIAVLNGVVLVTFFNQLHSQGYRGTSVVREGALRRLRPVLMTASIAAFGLVPLLFATGPGSEIQKPLASVVIGGLVSSTTLTLLLLPLLYRHFVLRGEAAREPSTAHAAH